MGNAAVIPSGIAPVEVGQVLKLVGLPSETERTVKNSAHAELINTIALVIDDLVIRAVEKRTAADFIAATSQVFPQYFSAMRAFGDLIRIVCPEQAIERLMSESLSELENDFKNMGPTAFGSDLSGRAVFTVWTLRKIKDLAKELGGLELSTDSKAEQEMAMKFATHAVWSRFHVDCLVKSMHSKRPIFPEVVDPIINGLRAAVDAYAWLRQAIDLRAGIPEPEIAPIPWDQEDEYLLADSMNTLREPC